jgi:hypothetical protein
MINVDVSPDKKIMVVEVLDRDDIRARLDELLPLQNSGVGLTHKLDRSVDRP